LLKKMKFIVSLCGILAWLCLTDALSLGDWKDIELADVPKDTADYGIKTVTLAVGGKENAVRVIGITSAKSQTESREGYKLVMEAETTRCPPTASPDDIQDSKTCPTVYTSTCTLQFYKSLDSDADLALRSISCSG
jgi:hypothetical protein